MAPVSARDESVFTNILIITEDLARKLKLKPCGIRTISHYHTAFGDTYRNVRNLEKAVVKLHTQIDEMIAIKVPIVFITKRLNYNIYKV